MFLNFFDMFMSKIIFLNKKNIILIHLLQNNPKHTQNINLK
jgi:hypothetical protein